jgi:hypothetical protein
VRALAGLVGGALALVGYPSYLRGVLAGRVRPAITSWWAWFVSALIVVGSQLLYRPGWSVLLAVAQALGLGAVLLAARGRARSSMTPTDLVCLGMAVSGAVVGAAAASPRLAVGAVIVGNVIAGVPTYRSVWVRPENESPWLWLACGAGGGLAAFAAPSLGLVDAGYPIYILVADTGIAMLAIRHRLRSGAERVEEPETSCERPSPAPWRRAGPSTTCAASWESPPPNASSPDAADWCQRGGDREVQGPRHWRPWRGRARAAMEEAVRRC